MNRHEREDKRVRKLEELKHLRAQWGATGLNAWRYMKTIENFEKLLRNLPADLPHPSLNEVIYICEMAKGFFCAILEYLSNDLSSLENLGLDATHYICNPFEKPEESYPLPEELDDRDDMSNQLWTLDYQNFLIGYCLHSKFISPLRKAFLATISLWMDGNWPLLTHVMSGKRITLGEFCENAEFWQNNNQQASIKAFLSIGIISEAEYQECFAKGSDNPELTPSVHDRLKKDKVENCWVVCKDLIESFLDNPPVINNAEARFLLKENPYKWAVKELTLKQLWTERRVALQSVYHYLQQDKSEPSSIIDSLIDDLKIRLRAAKERFKRCEDLVAPSLFFNRVKETIEETRYRILALKKNRKWLIEFLSH